MKSKIAFALAGLFGALGFWFGEGTSPPWAVLPVVGSIIGCFAIAFVTPGKLWFKSLAGAGSLVLYVTALFVGSLSFDHAFNECVERGEEVRTQLSEYHQNKNQYPERLGQLEGFKLCVRIIRPTLLEYDKTKYGYVLSFKDWLVEHTATESVPFMAHK